jgi:hypothetical protein
MKYKLFSFITLCCFLALPHTSSAATFSEQLKGRILLQVQTHGEAWYVYPRDPHRYYLKDGPAAYNIMRAFGLGISNTDLSRLLAGNLTLKSKLRGWIVLKVQSHGEAYYVCPQDNNVYYLKDGPAAYNIMRRCSLGITNANLARIPVGSIGPSPSAPLFVENPTPIPTPIPAPTPTPIPTSPVPVSPTPIPSTTTTTVAPTPQPSPTTSSVSSLAGCQLFPADNPWNQDISQTAVHPNSATYINSISATRTLHADFGENQEYGIPFTTVGPTQSLVPITFTAYGDESDPGPYPIPLDATREVSGDHHVLVLQSSRCMLYELYNAARTTNGWSADSAAKWDLTSNALRTEGWTSADAAGLPILPGLVRYDEVAAGEIKHALRFTSAHSQNGHILPATHHAGTSNTAYPPMGLRVRLKADYDISKLTGQAKIIALAMKKYGMILADNGTSWYFSGATDPRWNDDELNQLKLVPGSAFEAVYTGEIRK